jgi:hypothetical protein
MNYDQLQYGDKVTAQKDTDIKCGYDFDKRQDICISKGDVLEVVIVRQAYFAIRISPEHVNIRLPRSFYRKYFKPESK